MIKREEMRIAVRLLRSVGFIVTEFDPRQRTLTVRLPEVKG